MSYEFDIVVVQPVTLASLRDLHQASRYSDTDNRAVRYCLYVVR
jgi:hypothetical protein